MTELGTHAQRGAFDEWVDAMRAWHRELEVTPDPQVTLSAKFADRIPEEIGFGRYAGQRRWERAADIPSAQIKDELLRLLVWQGDSEVRAVEQARELLDSAPSEHDRNRLARHMTEETRHGWQMAYLLVTHFGEEGRAAARELLERRATRGEALLEMFNVKLNWVDVFSWHNWGDRVGKYQLTMFAGSAFAPFARSIAPMLKEEGFHLVIGYQGMQRICAANKVPVEIHQRYLNRMLAICYDAFGSEVSKRAQKLYDWGLKPGWTSDADPARVNEQVRNAFMDEARKLLGLLNRLLPAEGPKLHLTDPRFNRKNGPFSKESYRGPEQLPTAEDAAALEKIFRQPDWIAPPQG
ncbi:MAG TPA: Phenylacetic acid catabolic protein [Burkholderiales bacterium]|nr:Phenylacetic acid catabolic protein [Burkholderiales bacterium]